MVLQPSFPEHTWVSPSTIAAMLEAVRHGDHWRAACPAHSGENPQSLSIREGRDKYGHPMTLLHCFAHECSIEDICRALGISVRHLFCIQPDYAKATQNLPRA